MITVELSILNIIILFGAIQGFILAFILITTRRLSKHSNRFLALLLFTLSLLNLSSTLELMPNAEDYHFIRYLPCFWVNLIPPSIYFFVKYLIQPNHKWNRLDTLFFLPFAIEGCHRFYRFGCYLSGNLYTEAENQRYYLISNIYESFAVIVTIIVIIYCIKALKKYETRLYENYSDIKDKSLSWLRKTLIAGLALSVLWSIVTASDFDYNLFNRDLATAVLLGLSVLIYWIGYSMIIRQDLLDTPIFAVSENSEPEPVNNELSSRADDHYIRIKKMIEDDEVFKDPNLNMSSLSELTGLSNGYLSQIINQKQGQNFFDFINGYRVAEVKKKISDPSFDHYTLLGLAEEAGFKSKSTFNAVFKKMTGKTPSEYKKGLR